MRVRIVLTVHIVEVILITNQNLKIVQKQFRHDYGLASCLRK